MKVSFPSLDTDEKKRLIWNVNRKTNQATCTYKYVNSDEKASKNTVNDALKVHEGISFKHQKAIIQDFDSFKENHEPCQVLNQEQLSYSTPCFFPRRHPPRPPLTPRELTDSPDFIKKDGLKRAESFHGKGSKNNQIIRKTTNFFLIDLNTLIPEKGDSCQHSSITVYEESRFEEKSAAVNNKFTQIDLNTLFPEEGDSCKHSSITVYEESRFEEKSAAINNKLTQSELYLKSARSFGLKLQSENHLLLHQLKSQLIKTIRKLMDGYLNKAYKIWCQDFMDFHCEKMVAYFTQAVIDAMSNDTFNMPPTAIESMSPTAIKEEFNGNSRLYKAANRQFRKTIANLMLRKFLILVNDEEYCIDEVCPDEEMISLLTSFREYLHGYELCLKRPDSLFEKNKLYMELIAYDLIEGSEEKIKNGEIKFQCSESGLMYWVLGLDNKLKIDTIKWTDLPRDFPRKNSDLLMKKNTLLPDLLATIAEKEHILTTPYALYYTVITDEKTITRPISLPIRLEAPLTLEQLQPYLLDILKITTANSHTRLYKQVNFIQNIQNKLLRMQDLIIQIGQTLLKNKQSIYDLEQRRLENKAEKFNDVYSFKVLVMNFIQPKLTTLGTKKNEPYLEKHSEVLATTATNTTIKTLISSFMRVKGKDGIFQMLGRPYIAELKDYDTDFYICEAWAKPFKDLLKRLNSKDLKELCECPDNEKRINKFAQNIADIITEFVADFLKDMEEEPEKTYSAASNL